MVEEDLGRFRYHTGAQPTRVDRGETCPPLFRDVGFEAMRRFLRGELHRLCGPISPITYLRTADYTEPYIDYGQTGRIMLLSPTQFAPWHSGIESVFIASKDILINCETMVFIPNDLSLHEAATRFGDATSLMEVSESVGHSLYEESRGETLSRLEKLVKSHEESERIAAPLRRLYQSPLHSDRDRARELMDCHQLCEADLCTAWSHLPTERREFIHSELTRLSEVLT